MILGQLAYCFDNPKNPMIMPKCDFGTRDFGEEDRNGNPIIEDTIAIGGYYNVIPETVGQFTGLHDTNGREIYEGDVVQHDAWDYPFKVIFNQEKARFVCKMRTGLTQYIDNERMEVIGNIHENPELLNQ